MCEHRNKCGAHARILHATTGFCPYGTDASDATLVNKNNAALLLNRGQLNVANLAQESQEKNG